MPPDPRMSEVPCELRPRPNVSEADRQRLYDCLADWTQREATSEDRRLLFFDHAAAASIELDPEEPAPIDFVLRRPSDYHRARLIDYLKEVIPPELVDDISVDGRSWTDLAD